MFSLAGGGKVSGRVISDGTFTSDYRGLRAVWSLFPERFSGERVAATCQRRRDGEGDPSLS